MEDHSNRTRLAKLLRFYSSNSDKEMTSLAEYIERMKEKQDAIYFMAGTSRKEVRSIENDNNLFGKCDRQSEGSPEKDCC